MTGKEGKSQWGRNPEERFLQQELEVSDNRKKLTDILFRPLAIGKKYLKE